MACYLACWRVLDARVGVELPAVLRDLPVGAGPCFLLVPFDAAVVDWAAFGFFGERGCAGDRGWRWVDVWAERLLPRGVVGSLLTGPAVGVGCTGLTEGCIIRPSSRAITSLSQRIIYPQ